MSQRAMSQIPGVTIIGVRPDSTRNGRAIFKVQTSDGQERSTFDAQSANKAAQLVNQPGTLIISFSADGKYQNYEDFLPGDGAALGGGFPASGTFSPQQPQPQFAQGATLANLPVFTPPVDLKEKRIIRGNALNAAAAAASAFIGTGFFLDEERVNTDDVAGFVTKLAALFVKFLDPEQDAPVQETAPLLPPGVTAEQALALLASAGLPVVSGAAVAAAQDAAAEAPDTAPAEEKPY